MTVRLVVASTNPVKRRAAVEAVQVAVRPHDLEIHTVDVSSGVADQPVGDEETLRGARNRADAAVQALPDADLWVGLEGGIDERDGVVDCMAWAVVLGRCGTSAVLRRGESRTATFALPDEIASLVRSGMELGSATDLVLDGTDTKRGTGTVGPLTGGVIDRVAFYAHAVVLALVPFVNDGLTFAGAASVPASGEGAAG